MPQPMFEAGLAAHRAGRPEEAEALYRSVLAEAPEHANANYLLGTLLLSAGTLEEGIALTRRAAEAEPRFFAARFNLGTALREAGRLEEAAAAFGQAVEIDPDHAATWLQLAEVRASLGQCRGAFEAAERAAALDPGLAEARYRAGLALRGLGRVREAEARFTDAVSRDPSHAGAWLQLSILLQYRADRDAEAEAALRRAWELPTCRVESGAALWHLTRDRGDAEGAEAVLAGLLREAPSHPVVRLMQGLSALRPVHDDAGGPARMRAEHVSRVDALDAWVREGGGARLAAFSEAVGTIQPFHLPYAGGVDREAQVRFGRLCHDAMQARYGQATIATPPAAGERIRVGFVSGFFRHHSNWKIPLRGWMEGLDRTRFALFGYHTDVFADRETERARSCCERFEQQLSSDAMRDVILRDRPHVLVHAETGMNGNGFRLACQRLAPVQCVSWGHPITSGLPVMDVFLSSAAMEPDGAEAQYSETLVLLPGLGFDLAEPLVAPAPARRGEFGLPEDCTLFLCGQALSKYLPDNDAAFVRIARAVPDAVLVFLEPHRGRALSIRVRARLGRAFSAGGLDPDRHLRFLDRLSPERFASLSAISDVVLDGIDWSGCNSTIDGLAGGTPVVTVEGATMRARHTSAILRQIGVTETIAVDLDGFVAIATKLARDPLLRATLRARIIEGGRRLAESRQVGPALGAVLAGLVGRA